MRRIESVSQGSGEISIVVKTIDVFHTTTLDDDGDCVVIGTSY